MCSMVYRRVCLFGMGNDETRAACACSRWVPPTGTKTPHGWWYPATLLVSMDLYRGTHAVWSMLYTISPRKERGENLYT